MIEAAAKMTTAAYRRVRASAAGERMRSQVSATNPSGTSNARPKVSTMEVRKPKYAEASYIGFSEPRRSCAERANVAGTAKKYASAAPTANRMVETPITVITSRRSCAWSAGERKAQTW